MNIYILLLLLFLLLLLPLSLHPPPDPLVQGNHPLLPPGLLLLLLSLLPGGLVVVVVVQLVLAVNYRTLLIYSPPGLVYNEPVPVTKLLLRELLDTGGNLDSSRLFKQRLANVRERFSLCRARGEMADTSQAFS